MDVKKYQVIWWINQRAIHQTKSWRKIIKIRTNINLEQNIDIKLELELKSLTLKERWFS